MTYKTYQISSILTKLLLMLCLVQLEKQLNHALIIKLNGKKLYQPDSIKYLGIHLGTYLEKSSK